MMVSFLSEFAVYIRHRSLQNKHRRSKTELAIISFLVKVKLVSLLDSLSYIRMAKRVSSMDDKLLSEMILNNIASASQMNIDMANILNEQQMQVLLAYEQMYNYQSYLTFFLTMGLMSHFSQNSYYTHFASPDRRPVQLYLWLLGASGESLFHTVQKPWSTLRFI